MMCSYLYIFVADFKQRLLCVLNFQFIFFGKIVMDVDVFFAVNKGFCHVFELDIFDPDISSLAVVCHYNFID